MKDEIKEEDIIIIKRENTHIFIFCINLSKVADVYISIYAEGIFAKESSSIKLDQI